MARKFVSERNLKFLLYEVFDTEEIVKFDYYKQHNRKMFDMILDAAMKFAKEMLLPCFEEMDRKPPELQAGQVVVHPSVCDIMKEAGEGGWIASNFSNEFDGEQLPHIFAAACRFIFSAANYSGSIYPELTAGAARLITSFGGKELVSTYVPKMLQGTWQGTMALTEPQAGSSLADITTEAAPADDGTYRIKGQKIFISAGDHDGVENVVHLMLAKIDGAPSGVKGISLFVVPKKRFDGEGRLVSNDVTVASVYHKLGYRGTPITELSMGEKNDCHGYLVGAPHRGLQYMFQMMNESRLGVGLGATAIASAAYHAALAYAKERPQGRSLSEKDPNLPQVPIIQHADVRRMLLFQKAVVEGALALNLQCWRYADMALVTTGEKRQENELLLDILTPVAKTYPAEMGILSTSQALQCFGGYGYCDDFPVEQHFRDTRIHPIHEGTTGIQGLDLLGRKVLMQDGKAFKLYQAAIEETVAEAKSRPELLEAAEKLEAALEKLRRVTEHKIQERSRRSPEIFLADATLYLEFFGIITIGWQWLRQALLATAALEKKLSKKEDNFYQGKLYTFRYYFSYELPKIEGLRLRLMEEEMPTVDMEPEFFTEN